MSSLFTVVLLVIMYLLTVNKKRANESKYLKNQVSDILDEVKDLKFQIEVLQKKVYLLTYGKEKSKQKEEGEEA